MVLGGRRRQDEAKTALVTEPAVSYGTNRYAR